MQRIVHSPTLLGWAGERLRRSAVTDGVLLRQSGTLRDPPTYSPWQTLAPPAAHTLIHAHRKHRLYARPEIAHFQLAADIQDWPVLLPHYREVIVFEQTNDGTRKFVEMAAVRDNFPLPGLKFPVRWRSVQVCEPDTGRIYFKHLAGIATGMWVVWSLEEDPGGAASK